MTPYAELYHHESKSRGAETTFAKERRYREECRLLFEVHRSFYEHGDPMYSPNLSPYTLRYTPNTETRDTPVSAVIREKPFLANH